jgi:6-methylsalicylate decarboxylase
MGLDFPLMPKSTFAPAIADVGHYPAFSEADLQSLSYGNASRLYPALKARTGTVGAEVPTTRGPLVPSAAD